MSVALVAGAGEVPHSDRAVDQHGVEGDVVGDGVLNETVLISSCVHRLTVTIVPTSTTINLTIERPVFNVEK